MSKTKTAEITILTLGEKTLLKVEQGNSTELYDATKVLEKYVQEKIKERDNQIEDLKYLAEVMMKSLRTYGSHPIIEGHYKKVINQDNEQ